MPIKKKQSTNLVFAILVTGTISLFLPDYATATYSYDINASANQSTEMDGKSLNQTTRLGVYSRKYRTNYSLLDPILPRSHPISHTESAFGVYVNWNVLD